MKIKQIYEKLLENWQVKAICFVISVFLYVIFQNQSLGRRTFTIPLNIEAKNGFVSIEPHPRTVSVEARGEKEALAQVRESDLQAYLDLNYVYKDGKYDFPVLITLSDSASALNPLELKVIPEKVSLKVEEEITAFVDIIPLVTGKPAYGYSMKGVSVSPEQIAITGPRTMIEKCLSLQTLNVTMNGAKRSFTSKVAVEKKGLFIKHDDVSAAVTVEIEEMDGSKVFAKLPVKILNLSPELELQNLSSEVTATLKGALAALESYRPDENFVTADLSAISSPGTHYVDLKYNVPKRFELTEAHTKSIPLTFVEKKETGLDDEKESQSSESLEEKITVVETPSGTLDEKVEKKKR
ncbi:MAG: hypothetical protein K5873_00995 [Treponema sp.]|nr:hypothetical protein [Treponema sp.]